MKFVQQTRDQLTIRLFPLVIWSVGIFFLMLAVTATSLLAQPLLASAGILIFSLGQASTCRFNKITDQVLIKRWTLLGSKQSRCSIRDVVEVHVEASGATYRVNLILAEGELFPLTTYYTGGLQEKQKVVERIRQFLYLPSTPIQTPSCDRPKLLELAVGEQPDRQQAIAEYRAAIEKDPDDLKNYYSLLLLLEADQQQDEAKATFAELKAILLKRGQPGYAAVLEEIFHNMMMKRS